MPIPLVTVVCLFDGNPLSDRLQGRIGGVRQLGDRPHGVPLAGLAIGAKRWRNDALDLFDFAVGLDPSDSEFQIGQGFEMPDSDLGTGAFLGSSRGQQLKQPVSIASEDAMPPCALMTIPW